MVFWRLSFLPYLKSFFKRPVYLFLKYLNGKQTDRDAKISKNHIYTSEVWIWFFGNIGLEVVFLWNISHQLVTPCALVIIDLLHPEYIWVLPWKLEEEKLKKPYLYQFGIDMVFWRFCLKPTPTGMWCIYMSQICVPLQKISQKQPKTTKNHIYTTLV